MKFSLAIILSLTSGALAVCPGFNYAIGNRIDQGKLGDKEVSRWNVYDDSCNVVDGLTTTENPCSEGIFGCSPAPIIFNRYACRTDPNAGRCGNDAISVCCRNDGKRAVAFGDVPTRFSKTAEA